MKKKIVLAACIILVIAVLAFLFIKKFVAYGPNSKFEVKPLNFYRAAVSDKMDFSTKTQDGKFDVKVTILDKYRFLIMINTEYPFTKMQVVDGTRNEVISSGEAPGGTKNFTTGEGRPYEPKYVLRLLVVKDGKERWNDIPMFKKR